ncbi:MAG: RDD family protein [Eubacteriales bacterium]|nr:RDD family protein [Eubacteriales bacterium]
MYRDSSNDTVVFAGFWVRLAAFLIDSLLVSALLLFARLFLFLLSLFPAGDLLNGHLLFQYSLSDMVLYGCGALYYILFTYFTGVTPGKRLLNLRVVTAGGGRELSLLCVVYRETVGRFLSGFLLGIGYLMAGIDREKRALHDMLADTRVVYEKPVKICRTYREPGYVRRQQAEENAAGTQDGDAEDAAADEQKPSL